MNKKIIVGSRGSDLALWQANFVKDALQDLGVDAEIKIIKTQGDKIQDLSFDKMEGKGFFTKEIETALLENQIDLAVHSHKDLETTPPKGLSIAAVSRREDPSELLIIRKEAVDEKKWFSLKKNALVGTSSARRKALLLNFRADLKLKDLRGNVPTRIDKLRKKEYDAILLAAAGVERLEIDLDEFHVEVLDPKEFVPAPAQGVLAFQIREEDTALKKLLEPLNDEDAALTSALERKVLQLFEGGCQLPLGVYCERDENESGDAYVFKVWCSMAEAWNKPIKLVYQESINHKTLPQGIVTTLKKSKPCSVFITRNLSKNSLLKNVLSAHGYKVFGETLIEIKTIQIKKVPKTDWIFFSSKNAVKHFFEQQPDIQNAKLGAVGKSTSVALRKMGKKANFIGYSTDTILTGKQFSATVGNGRVLFPTAKGSLRSIQQQFQRPENVIDLSVYETIQHHDVKIPPADILIFTSPSNVEAFFVKNKVKATQKVIAIGESTGNTLKHNGVKNYFLPKSFDDIGFLQAVFGIK